MKKCPFCAEEIQEEAIKCKHCGSMVDDHLKHQQKSELKSFWKRPIFICCLLILMVFSAVFFLVKKDSSGPGDITARFVIEVKNGDYKNVRQYMSTEAKEEYSDSYLKRMHEKFTDSVTYTGPERLVMTGDEAVQIIEVIGDNQDKGVISVYLEKSFWGWKIVDIN